MNDHFFESDDKAWQQVSAGMKRQVMAHDENIMLVKVHFSKDAIGAMHIHIHSQATFVLSGVFEITIDKQTKTLKQGDCFIVPQNTMHGAVCIREGTLIDVFSPARKDFLEGRS